MTFPHSIPTLGAAAVAGLWGAGRDRILRVKCVELRCPVDDREHWIFSASYPRVFLQVSVAIDSCKNLSWARASNESTWLVP